MQLLCHVTSLLVVAVLIDSAKAAVRVHVGAFALNSFGNTKMGKPDVVASVVQIVHDFEIILLQEFRDSSEQVPGELLAAVNVGLAAGDEYAMVLGSRVGRTSYKEQYAFFYKPSIVSVVDWYEYDDGVEVQDAAGNWNDKFNREPLCARFSLSARYSCAQYSQYSCGTPALNEFFACGLHTDPEEAPEEIAELVNVRSDAVSHFGGLQNGLLLGDFNADCAYFTAAEMAVNPLREDVSGGDFKWLINDQADTSTYSANCAYDRIVAVGSGLKPIAGYPEVYRFDLIQGLNVTQTNRVSGNYPVKFQIVLH